MKFEELTLGGVLDEIARLYPDKEAIIYKDTSITYEELNNLSDVMAARLSKMGIGKNDKIAILMPNCFEFLCAYFAIFKLGAWAVPLNIRYQPPEIENVLRDSEAVALITVPKYMAINYIEALNERRDNLPDLKHIIVKGENIPEGMLSLESLLLKEEGLLETFKRPEIEPEDVAMLAYTSGTTGIPKGVMIPHRTLILTSAKTVDSLGFSNRDIAISIAPLFAAQGFLATLVYLTGGVGMVWLDTFNPAQILEAAYKYKPTIFHTQPTMWTMLMNVPKFDEYDFSSLRMVVTSGSVCPKELAETIERRMKATVVNIYGLIEATGVTTLTYFDDSQEIRLGTVGRAIPGVELKVVNDKREEIPTGEVGELAVKGYLMKGYYKKPDKTAEVIDKAGWLYSGDLATMDNEGNVHIVGLCKDMIIRGGFNIYPIDIEECLLKHPQILNVAVVGVPRPVLGEAIVAFIILKPEVELSTGEAIRFCRDKIANYKVPDEVRFVSELPVSPAGKVLKKNLREMIIQEDKETVKV